MRRFLVFFLMLSFVALPVSGQTPGAGTGIPASQAPSTAVSVDPDSLRMSLDYTNADLPLVLKSIAYSYDLNMVISEKVTGKVSAQLKDVTIDDGLKAILELNGYQFSRQKNIVYITSNAEAALAIEVVTLKYLYAKEAKDLFVKVLSSRGDVQVNESTNSLIFMDFAENLQKVKALAEEVDQPPLQVLIEARLVDIKTTDMRKIGTEISATYTAPRGHLGTIGLQTGSSTKQSDGGQLALSPSFKHLDASVTIDALIAQSRARILASPSIATLSGLEARIIIGDRIPYTSASSTITAGTGNTTTTTETKFLEVGTTLKVTPLVSSDGWITMKIHPEVSSFVKFVDDNPQTTTREADATIRVRDNETIIIGGLISKTKNDQDNGVPGLRSIPLVGRLFRRTENQDDQSELMVFITPHIIRSSPDKPYLQEAPSEVFVDIQKNVDQDLLSGLLGYADSLERDLVAKPSDSLYLNAELLKTYKMIYDQYPQAGRADYCLYKMIMIYVREFDKCQAAQEILTSLRRGFPESPYLGAAEKIARSCAEITLPAMSVPEGTERN